MLRLQGLAGDEYVGVLRWHIAPSVPCARADADPARAEPEDRGHGAGHEFGGRMLPAVEAVDGFDKRSQWEGILPALESSHAIAWVVKNADQFSKDELLIINVSGRGDKDVQQLAEWKKEHQEG